ncbi:histidine phosphatase family protein [Nitrosomonas supralitoralis]|uniref:Histidine phosphatase family protein n=1 Tax=Nitrosomonas supralitoralis TaxID=2116706 RepID=A0A2P7NVW3_9PROT|nr:alpha-ribazole phosphatase family protein [Nitrosomonas supralitoralis]PSJ17565.1 histidine phosphatase family protein [Nitrosomonas supralitoralis]
MTETLIDLIRHGEPIGGRRYRGHGVDDPLSEKGWSQMWRAVGDCNQWQQIITSPLQRCQAFAYALGERYDINVSVEPRFKEVGFGEWEGLSHDEVKIGRMLEYQAFLQNPVNARPLGAEPLDDFVQRVYSAYEAAIERYSSHHILIVAHAGVMRALIAKTLQAPAIGLYRIKISNGGVTRIRHTGVGAVLELLNGKLSA